MEVKGWNQIDFTPVEADVYFAQGATAEKVPGYKAIVRDDIPLGVVTDKYEILDHRKVFDEVDASIGDQDIPVTSKSVKATHNGAKAFMEWKFDRTFEARKGDDVTLGLRAVNSYDGSMRLGIETMLERQLCSNGLTGLVEVTEKTRKHVRGIGLFDIEGAVDRIFDQINTFEDRLQEIAEEFMHISKAKTILEKLNLPQKYIDPALEQLGDLDVVSVWDLYNAVNTAVNHEYGGKDYGNRLELERETANIVRAVV